MHTLRETVDQVGAGVTQAYAKQERTHFNSCINQESKQSLSLYKVLSQDLFILLYIFISIKTLSIFLLSVCRTAY